MDFCKKGATFIIVICFFLISSCGGKEKRIDDNWEVIDSEIIDEAASDFDIRFSLFKDGNDIYVAYYDGNHRLKVAVKDSAGSWNYVTLNETVSWDSHKYVTMAVDREGFIHLSGNMHNDTLVYYKSSRPRDILSLRKQSMTGVFEDSVTYPEFVMTDSSFVFHYRNGKSGNGSTFINTYDYTSGEWSKLSLNPLFDGQRQSNSYFKGPIAGPDGFFHLIWCWRDEPECETNHGLYYAFSSNLLDWQSLNGFSKSGPINPDDSEFLVDDIKKGEGLINGGFSLGFDDENKPIVSYHKYDENDHTNIYAAVFENGDWAKRRITDWNYKWDFSGRGSIPFEIIMDKVWRKDSIQYFYISRMEKEGFLSNHEMESYLITYNEKNGEVLEHKYTEYPSSLKEQKIKNKLVHIEIDRGNDREDSIRYLLRYETEYPSRDKQIKDVKSAKNAQNLYLYKIIKK